MLIKHQLRTSPLRALLSAISVSLGTAMVVAASTLGNGLRRSFDTGSGRPNGTTFVVDFTEMSLQGVGAIILIAAGFLIFNAFMMAVTQRQKEVGLLRSLGMTRGQVLRLVVAEGIILGGAGSLLGLLLGPLLGNGILSFMGNAGFAVGSSGRPSLGSLLLAVVIGLGITLLSMLVPALRAARMTPLAALRHSDTWKPAARPANRGLFTSGSAYPVAGLMLFVTIGGILLVAPPGSWADPPTNVRLALLLSLGWLAGVLLLLPRLTGRLARWVKRPLTLVAGVVGSMIGDNLNRSRQRVLFTLLTFVIGLTMIVSTTGVLTFMTRVLFDLLLEQTAAEAGWGLWPFDQTQGALVVDQINNQGFSPEIVADVRATVGERALIARNFMVIAPEVSAMFPNFPSTIVDPEAFGHGLDYNFTEGNLETAMSIMASGCGLLIPPDVAGRHDAAVGDVIRLQGIDHSIYCTVAGIGVAGIYPSTLISPAAMDAFAVKNPIALVVVPQPGTDAIALKRDLRALDRKYGEDLWLIKADESSAALQEGGDMLIGLLNVMLLLAVLAAGMGVVNTTMMSVTQRRQELGLLRALGATRGQVRNMVMGEAAFIGLVGGLTGLFAGAGISMLFALSFGGRSYGIPEIPLWQSAWRATQPALLIGFTGAVMAPIISAAAAIFPVGAILRGKPVALLYNR